MKNYKCRQGGWSFSGLLVVLVVVGIFVAVGFKLVPAYTDHETLKSIMQSTISDQALLSKSKREIKAGIGKKTRMNNMRDIPKDYVKITKEKGEVFLNIDYEIRIPIFANVDAVVSFKEQYVGRELE
ncbi:MAG: DUF4845 domain-containing protein [Motiliproteus sp.]